VVLPSVFMHYTAELRQHGFAVVIDAADVLTHLSASFLQNLRGRGGRLGLYANHVACRTQERIFLRRASELWTTSSAEADDFRRIAGDVPVLVIPNSLDETAIRPERISQDWIIGFIGTYSYTPNLHAAQFLAEQVFPRVLEACPDATLRIAGAGMLPGDATRLKSSPHVEVLGRVPDSGRFMDECAVLALPVVLRGGVPLKLVEAMAHAKAIVATPELANGTSISDDHDALVRSTPEDFAAAIIALLRDPSLRERLGANARATFEHHFSLSSAEATLRSGSVLGGRVAHKEAVVT